MKRTILCATAIFAACATFPLYGQSTQGSTGTNGTVNRSTNGSTVRPGTINGATGINNDAGIQSAPGSATIQSGADLENQRRQREADAAAAARARAGVNSPLGKGQ